MEPVNCGVCKGARRCGGMLADIISMVSSTWRFARQMEVPLGVGMNHLVAVVFASFFSHIVDFEPVSPALPHPRCFLAVLEVTRHQG